MSSPTASHRRPSPAAIFIIIPLVVALVLTLFAWPAARLEPRDVPIGVAGAPAAATAIERQLAARDGAFDTHRYADEAAAREAIEDREVYGAFVATSAPLIVQSWLDVIGGDWLVNAGALSLTVLAVAAVVAGLETLLGKAGAALAALTMVLIGNPFSGVASGPEMLPTAAGTLGQLLPPGAGGNLLRSTGLFDGAAAGGHVTVLALWALAGLALLFVSAARRRRTAPVAVPAAA